MVIASSAAIDKPVVRINRDNTGKALEMCDQHLIDLSKDPKGELTVVELLT